MSVSIHAGNDLIDLVLVEDDGPLRVARFGVHGAVSDIPGGRPAVEVITVDSGQVPSTPRLVGGVASANLRYVSHQTIEQAGSRVTIIKLLDDLGLEALLRLEVLDGVAAVRSTTSVTNFGSAVRVLRSVTSLSMRVALGTDAITSPDLLGLYSADSDWVGESRWSRRRLRELLVDLRSSEHDGGGARGSYSVASTGTWSTGRSLPVGALVAEEGSSDGYSLAWQIEHNGGWRWETGEDGPGVYLALAGPTDADHQWRVSLHTGESFESVPASLALGLGLEGAIGALTDLRRKSRRSHPDNITRPVVYNDYMNTLMGDPTTERLLPLIDQAAEAGAEIFCIDAGWYDDSGDWWYSVGDWQPSSVRFPGGGLRAVVDRIRDRDMVPGLWLEPEVIGIDSPAASRLPDEAFLQLAGQRIVQHGRFHLDLRNPAAIDHLNGVVDRLVNELGIGYFKLDYNINPGSGTDLDSTAPGDGLLRHNRAHLDWLERVLERHPTVVIENCASGAMRMDFAMLSRLQLQSTSDQQSPTAYPPIAALAPLAMLPEQAANWAYPQPDMTDEEIAFTLCTSMLGRFYLSGHLVSMNPAQLMLVADGVASHKRLRSAIGLGRASWPLGVDLWENPWVALALGDAETKHLTLWRRERASETIEIPLPGFRGRELFIDVVFPRQLTPWITEWHSEEGVLHVTAAGDHPAARTFRISTTRPIDKVSVHIDSVVGPVYGGATGMLYGLADAAVPARSLIAGVRPRTLAQKAPGGLQHPGGDALEVANSYFAAGGTDILIYLQDLLAQWPYEEVGIEVYASLVRAAVEKVAESPDVAKFVWVPFNEGDWIWYSDWARDRDRFLADWTTLFRVIREAQPGARIAGPNESHYYPDRVSDFMRYCVENDTVPDVMSWHELQPSSLEVFPAHLAHYRKLETDLGLSPLPLNIDEFANRRDTSVPGRILQWIDLLETAKVDGDLAYWTMAGNLDDHAVGQREANSGWWLLHWYAQLRGDTLHTMTEHHGVRDSLHALAARDGDVLTVLIGGGRNDIGLSLSGLPDCERSVRVERVVWSGYEGSLEGPDVIFDDRVPAIDGELTLSIPNSDPFDAYRVLVTPDHALRPVVGPVHRTVANMSEAKGVDVEWIRYNDDWQQYAGTGTHGIRSLLSESSRIIVPFHVGAPGEWDLGLLYGTDASGEVLSVAVDDESFAPLPLPATLSRGFLGRVTFRRDLEPGAHTLTIAAGGPKHHADVALDRLDVSPVVGSWCFDATVALRTGGSTQFPKDGVEWGVRLAGDDDIHFFVGAPCRGRYLLELDATGASTLQLEGTRLASGSIVALPAGISEVVARPAKPGSPVVVRGLTMSFVSDLDPLIPLDWSDWHEAKFLVAPTPGKYLMTLRYSNGERNSGHEYNVDVINLKLVMWVGGRPISLTFPFTNDWENSRDFTEIIDVPEGADQVWFEISNGSGPRITGIAFDLIDNLGQTDCEVAS